MGEAGERIHAILARKRLAIVGVSRKAKHYSRVVWRELARRGYDLVPVNPAATDIEGVPAVGAVAAISPPPEAVIALTAPDRAAAVLADAHAAGVTDIWLRMKSDAVPPDPGMRVVAGYCPLMFLPDAGLVHRFHRFLLKVTGRDPG